MTKEEIAKRLAARPVRTDRSDDHTARLLGQAETLELQSPPALVNAAVLVPLVKRRDKLTVLLTERAEHLLHHPGQISFPGGRFEPEDGDAIDCALRESNEEIGLVPEQIEVLGRLDDYVTVTGFKVVPVVATVSPPLELKTDPFEVADVFEVPLAFLLERANYRRHFRVMPSGEKRHFYAVPFESRYIWGATAGMLLNLCEVLGGPCAS